MQGPFREVWAVDFEFIHPEGELPRPLCLVAWELRSGQKIRLWKDRFGRNPPYSIAADSLFVSYAAASELGCHLLLGWSMPERVLDLLVEFRRAINTTPVHPVFKEPSLLKALTYYGLDGVSAGEKTYWREVIMRGEPYTEEEQNGILDYCETDVVALARLLPVMVSRSHIDLPRALLRGRYMAAIARKLSECRLIGTGLIVCANDGSRSKSSWSLVWAPNTGSMMKRARLVKSVLPGIFDGKAGGWPLHEDGRMDLKDKTFKAMATIHPELEPLRQLRYSRDKLKLNELAVGQDGFNRCWLNPFGSRTSRNQPSNKKFIFGPAVWLRDFLIRPKEGWGLAYIDWISQEVGVLAGLSRDSAMMEAYNSEDFYITFGIQANLLPPGATGKTHKAERDPLKVVGLATQYGISSRSLAERINQPDIVGRQLLACHRRVYKKGWNWSDNRVCRALAHSKQETVFGWAHRFEDSPKVNSVRNFFVQGNAAEMMRLACCLATERGILVNAPIHDALLIMSPTDQLPDDIAKTGACMEEASAIVLNGFKLRTEAHPFLYPARFSDPKERGKKMLSVVMGLL